MTPNVVIIDQCLTAKNEWDKQVEDAAEQNGIAPVTDRFEASFYAKPIFDILLHFLPHYPYEIEIPIKISIERGQDSNCFIVCCEEFNKFGLGFTKEEAIEDFENNVVDDYLILNSTESDNLTNDAKDLLKVYKSHISLN